MAERTISKKYLKRYLRRKMKRIVPLEPLFKEDTFAFCWGQAMFDVLMDLDRDLKLGAFYRED